MPDGLISGVNVVFWTRRLEKAFDLKDVFRLGTVSRQVDGWGTCLSPESMNVGTPGSICDWVEAWFEDFQESNWDWPVVLLACNPILIQAVVEQIHETGDPVGLNRFRVWDGSEFIGLTEGWNEDWLSHFHLGQLYGHDEFEKFPQGNPRK
jgi:hypothetical protein